MRGARGQTSSHILMKLITRSRMGTTVCACHSASERDWRVHEGTLYLRSCPPPPKEKKNESERLVSRGICAQKTGRGEGCRTSA